MLFKVDKSLNYGRDIIKEFSGNLEYNALNVLDVGCGLGFDLELVKDQYPDANLFGIDSSDKKIIHTKNKNFLVNLKKQDIENEHLLFEDNSFDIIIANQVLEHCKNIHSIVSEMIRVLSIDGIMIIGVPNLGSFHNRLLMLFGIQPTCIKSDSGHVRGFTSSEIPKFVEKISGSCMTLLSMKGSNFYPFGPFLAKKISKIFPNLSVANFYCFKKNKKYEKKYISFLKENPFETNYFF